MSFLDAERVKASKGYESASTASQSNDEPQSAEVRMRFSNSKAGGSRRAAAERRGARLHARCARPAAVRRRGSHRPHQRRLGARAQDRRRLRRHACSRRSWQTRRISKRKTEYDMSYLVRNARATAAVVTLRQDGLWRENELIKESIEGAAHRLRQLCLGRAGPGERRNHADLHDRQRLVADARELRASRRCWCWRHRAVPKRRSRWSRRTRTPCRSLSTATCSR